MENIIYNTPPYIDTISLIPLSNSLNSKTGHFHFASILACSLALPPASVLTIPHGIGITSPIVILISLLYLFFRPGVATPFQPLDRWLLLAFSLYPITLSINILLHYNEFKFAHIDYPLRFLIVIPVFLALRKFRLPAQCLYIGFIFGALGAGLMALYQRFFLGIIQVNGFAFHISFGDISILLGFISLSAWPLMTEGRHKKAWGLLVLTAFAFGMTGSILSTARGSWIAAPFLFLILINKYITNTAHRIGISIVFLGACLGLYTVNDNINTRINLGITEVINYLNHSNTGDLTVNSVGSRMEMWKVGLTMFKENPWSGIGIGKYFEASGDLIKAGKMRPGAHYHHAHNDYITLLAESGIPGFLSLLFIYSVSWYYFSCHYRDHDTRTKTLATSGQLLIAGYAIFSLTQSNLNHNITTFFLAMMMATLAGMLSADSAISKTEYQ